MNIGIINLSYQCKDLLQRSLPIWLEIKKNPKLVPNLENLYISIVHGCFEETAAIGYPLTSTDGTIEYISQQEKLVDNFYVYQNPMKEYTMWSEAYGAIRDKIDVLMMINSDEIWTLDEINKALKYVQFEQFVTYFDVNFKNYVGDEKTYVNNFQCPRIWFTKKEGGLEGFYRDDRVFYKSEKKDIQCSNAVVPVRPKHLSWCGEKSYLQRKLAFQSKRYNCCSYMWDEKTDSLIINEEYYKKLGQPVPELFKD